MFQGYSNETIEFFLAIRFNNNRPFFLENRDWYLRAVRQPSLALAEALAPVAEEIDPDLERRPHRVVSRINRDIRFARDKSPYRDYVWLAFRRPGEDRGRSLGMYFDIGDSGASYGMGFYRENRGLMDALRRRMELAPDEVLELCAPVLSEFTLYAEPNRRIKVPENVPEALRPWYAAKGFYFEKSVTDFDLIFSPALAEEVKAGFQRLKPLYRYLLNLQPGEE